MLRIILLTFLSSAPLLAQARPAFDVLGADIAGMRRALADGRLTSRELVLAHLARIGLYEDQLHSIITVNPRALAEADERDRERAQGRLRGPLHGIPIALKDNILTQGLVTTGGALAFAGYLPPYDATLVRNLRDSGAIIIAKTGLTELANWVAGSPSPMPGNYNAVRGFAYNPYDPRRDPRDGNDDGRPVLATGGSSSGVGTAVSFWPANVGTETSGSILSPANQNMLVGIKPTVGRISRYGVIPITADQDTAGPMARTVADAALLLGALESPAPDPNDDATKKCPPPPNRDYTPFLKPGGLKGLRIGIPRAFFYDALPAGPPASNRRGGPGGLAPDQKRLMTEAISILQQQGAVIIDPVEIPSLADFLKWGTCSGLNQGRGKDANCSVVFKYGMKRDFNAWLTTLGPSAPVKSLTALREWNLSHTNGGALRFGQSLLDISDEMNLQTDKARYAADRAKDLDLAATRGLDAAMKTHRLDALLFPGASGAGIAAKPGYPTVIVPFGFVPNAQGAPFPPGFTPQPSPYGVSFTGLACSEPTLLQAAYAFEQATKRRVPPPGFR